MPRFTCEVCGALVEAASKRVVCSYCGAEYVREAMPSPGLGDFLVGVLVGTVFVAPFIWTPLGREFAVTAIQRGAGVTRAKVEEWLRKGS